MPDLASAVFVLQPSKEFVARQFMGRAANDLFYSSLQALDTLPGLTGYAALATELHNQNAPLPFTVGPLMQTAPAHFWMRVAALTPPMCETLQTMVARLPGHQVEDGWQVVFAALSQHEWAKTQTYAELLASAAQHTARTIGLEFVTPTLIKSIGVEKRFPEPALIFRLLFSRACRLPLQPYLPEIDARQLEAFCTFFVEVSDFQLANRIVRLSVDERGFEGQVRYRILLDNPAYAYHDAGMYAELKTHHADYTRLLHTLAALAFFTGVGKLTAQGLGMVRPLPPG